MDFDTDWVKLEWDKPEFDGGSAITGYVVERCEKQFQKWEACARSEGIQPICKVSGMYIHTHIHTYIRAMIKIK
jgi:hypothetical protein